MIWRLGPLIWAVWLAGLSPTQPGQGFYVTCLVTTVVHASFHIILSPNPEAPYSVPM